LGIGNLSIRGGTHIDATPSTPSFKHGLLPVLQKMGAKVSLKESCKEGFWPDVIGQIDTEIMALEPG
jgi:RNA 3'-terminal phosphate cyclase